MPSGRVVNLMSADVSKICDFLYPQVEGVAAAAAPFEGAVGSAGSWNGGRPKIRNARAPPSSPHSCTEAQHVPGGEYPVQYSTTTHLLYRLCHPRQATRPQLPPPPACLPALPPPSLQFTFMAAAPMAVAGSLILLWFQIG